MIAIRVDANEIIATGHVMRCLSIAKALRKEGQEVCFISADDKAKEIVSASEFQCHVLNTAWDDMDTELERLKAYIHQSEISCLIVDSYQVTPKYLSELRKQTKLVYIDDLDAFHYDCDVLINYACYAKDLGYEARYPDTKLLLGCEYVPLREEFTDLPPHVIREEVQDVLIMTGGTDNYHVALRLAEELCIKPEFQKIRFHIVGGRYNVDMERLEKLALVHENLILYPFVENMCELMRKMDLAISAGGSTLYELCACGVPTISYCIADNQLRNVKKFDELGVIPYAGDAREKDWNVMMAWNASMESGERKRMTREMRHLVIKRGEKCDDGYYK